jgi:5-methylcytosine-specific restriction protein A
MEMARGNHAILNSEKDGKEIYAFEYVRPGRVRYLGEMEYLGHHETQSPDRYGDLRKTIVFELGMVNEVDGEAEKQIEYDEKGLWRKPIDEVRKLAEASVNRYATALERRSNVYLRSQAIRVYVLRRANGICEACGEPAPFMKADGKPYLETHHIKRLADGGPDAPDQVAGVCPNCHRRGHYGVDREAFNNRLLNKIRDLEG